MAKHYIPGGNPPRNNSNWITPTQGTPKHPTRTKGPIGDLTITRFDPNDPHRTPLQTSIIPAQSQTRTRQNRKPAPSAPPKPAPKPAQERAPEAPLYQHTPGMVGNSAATIAK